MTPVHKTLFAMDAEDTLGFRFTVNNRFKETTKEERDAILDGSKPKNTKKSTDLWMSCFDKYLKKKKYPPADEIDLNDLPSILEKFYCEVEKNTGKCTEKMKPDDQKGYKNTTMRTIRAALARYYRDKKSIDIITNESFVRANQMFKGVQKINKQKGLGNIQSKTPLSEMDLEKLTNYFLMHISGPPNPRKLQEVMLFNVIFYLCRRGRENLRPMTKSTFQVAFDETSRREYIFQAEDELDKNHQEQDTSIANEGRIYELPGKINNFSTGRSSKNCGKQYHKLFKWNV